MSEATLAARGDPIPTLQRWRGDATRLSALPEIARAAFRSASGSRRGLDLQRDRAVRRVVAHAYRHVSFYRELMDRAGVTPAAIRGAGDLVRLPVTRKAELREQPLAAILAHGLDPRRLLSVSTTGSTGQPFRIYNSWLEYRILHLFRLRAHRQFGREPGDRLAEIDQPIPTHPNDSKWIGKALRALGLEARLQLSLYEPDDVLLQRLEEFNPDIVTAYPNLLLRLGRRLQERPLPRLRPRFLLTNSEILTPAMRSELRRTWGTRVFQFYDCHECNLIAWDCPDGHGLHCNEDVAVVEVLRDGRPAAIGEPGELAITSLHSYAMPLIRFSLGDIVTRGAAACGCGQPFATLQAVEGRAVDFFPLPDGRWLHPYRLIENFDADGIDWIRQYRLIQERKNRIVFSAVPSAGATPARLEAFRRHAADIAGPGVEIEARFVADLDLGRGDKFRPARSLVHSEYPMPDWTRFGPALTRRDGRLG